MAKSKINYWDAISALGLNYGSSPEEIKEAYRKLAKQYHPDVYKQDGGEKFKEIYAAYYFLRKHPDPPADNHQQGRQTRSVNDQERRRSARQQKQKKREVEESAQKEAMFKWLFSNLRLFVLIILLFNSLLFIDYLLPSVTQGVKIERIETVYVVSRYGSREGKVDSYNAILNNGMKFKFSPEEIGEIDINDSLTLNRTMIFQEGEYISSKNEDITIYTAYGIFRIYGFFIPLSITLILAYFYYIKNNDYRLTIFLIVAIIFVIQLVLLF